jgi:peptidoglycan/LPS O-acetylase OafA/YrhL
VKRIKELDGLRFLAIAAVFGVHFRPPYSPHNYALGLGWMGVDLFFAISGFLITSILLGLRNTPHAFSHFYGRRTLRIFPPYYVVLGILLLISVLHLGQGTIPLRRALGALTFTSSFNPPPFHAVYDHMFRHAPFLTKPMPLDNHIFSNISSAIAIFWSLSAKKSSISCGLQLFCSVLDV